VRRRDGAPARRRAAADDWYVLPGTADEVAARVRTALTRGTRGRRRAADRIERAEYEHLLYDARTGLPTLPVAIERSRAVIQERGELVVLYLNFVRYSKLEEIYGWEKLDAVLETTAEAVREFLGGTALANSRALVSTRTTPTWCSSTCPRPGGRPRPTRRSPSCPAGSRRTWRRASRRRTARTWRRCSTSTSGVAHVYHNPKVRLERLIYRGIREAANAAKSVAERERGRKVTDLRASLRDRLVYVDYHPIVEATTRACSATRRWRAG
jgi:hypothetical protein